MRRQRSRRSTPIAAAFLWGLGALLVGTPDARAGYLASFSGNTAPADLTTPGVDGYVSFTVLDRTTGGQNGADDRWGTGLANFDTTYAGAGLDLNARYLYLFETFNGGPNTLEISSNTVFVTPSLITSFGNFVGTQFSTNILGTPATLSDFSPASVGAAPVIVNSNSGMTPTLSLLSASLRANYLPTLLTGSSSYLWGYTSNSGPAFGPTSIIDGGTSARGSAPTAVPEPAAVISLAVGMAVVGLGFAARRRSSSV